MGTAKTVTIAPAEENKTVSNQPHSGFKRVVQVMYDNVKCCFY